MKKLFPSRWYSWKDACYTLKLNTSINIAHLTIGYPMLPEESQLSIRIIFEEQFFTSPAFPEDVKLDKYNNWEIA